MPVHLRIRAGTRLQIGDHEVTVCRIDPLTQRARLKGPSEERWVGAGAPLDLFRLDDDRHLEVVLVEESAVVLIVTAPRAEVRVLDHTPATDGKSTP